MRRLRIGTRGSELARWQAEYVRRRLLEAHPGLQIDLEVISTRGDRVWNRPLSQMSGIGIFTKEIEYALLDGSADVAVHSMKDLPTVNPDALAIAAVPERADPADCLVAPAGQRLEDLPDGATVLTSSLRRKAQVLRRRPDVQVRPVRGNVPTRVRKVEEGEADAMVLARAGLVRLGLEGKMSQRFDPASEFVPACGQGALAVQVRADDAKVRQICRAIDDFQSHAAVAGERAFLAALGGGCRLPLGGFGRFQDGRLVLKGLVTDLRGEEVLEHEFSSEVEDLDAAAALGEEMAAAMRKDGADRILAEVMAETGNEQEGGR